MIGGFVFVLTTAALLMSAFLVVVSMGLRSVPECLLGMYVIAYAELVLVVGLLSFGDLVVRAAVVAGVSLLLVAGAITWILSGRPRGPALRPALRATVSVLGDAPLATLAVAVALGFAYLTALALFTPANTFDALWYHLSRAAFWNQQHSVSYIADANDVRLNANPPVGEIGLLYTMVVSGSDRFVNVVSLTAYVALPLSVYGIARRLRIERRPALFAALAFAALPVVLLQAPDAKNDLLFASLATAAVYFSLGTRAVEAVLAGVAFALSLGTKIYAPLFLPVIALIVVAATPRRRWLQLAIAAVPAVAVGSAWYLVNLVQAGSLLGDLPDDSPGSGRAGVVDLFAITARYAIDFAELPGAAGWWVVTYVVAGLALAAALWANRSRWRRPEVVVAALIGLLPFVVIALGPSAKRGYQYVLFHSGRPDLGSLDDARSIYAAGEIGTYYGPLGLALLLSVLVVAYRRRAVPRVALVLAAAPLLFLLELAVIVGYDVWSGRFFEFAVALAVVGSAFFLSSRPLLWAVVAVAIPTIVLTLRANTEKPPSVWGKPRWEVQTLSRPRPGEEWLIIKYAEESVPRDARIGLAINSHNWSYPFFGPHLSRHLRFATSTQHPPEDVDWLVVSPRRQTAQGAPPVPWREVVRTPHSWHLYRRG